MQNRIPTAWVSVRSELNQMFSLSDDKALDKDIDAALRAGVSMKGTNLWVLIFAIFIASIGLNVNSTAVIIGAMLISPLMGPIMGIGYGVGIYDLQLIKTSFKNLSIAVVISLLTSVLYFTISPLTQAHSELLARTTPTIWDVLIALFGGLAGIIGATRREKSNLIPGVAIATALMPPLCTAGYGIATGNLAYFGGAFYLFTINSVFIALATAVVIRAFQVQTKNTARDGITARVRHVALAIALVTTVPSVYLAYTLVQTELFRASAEQFVAVEFASEHSYVAQSKIDASAKLIELTIIGEAISAQQLAAISAKLPAAGLSNAKLKVHQQLGEEKIDLSSLKSGVLNDLYSQSQAALEAKDQELKKLQAELQSRERLESEIERLPAELQALFPQIKDLVLAEGLRWEQDVGMAARARVVMVNLKLATPLGIGEELKIESWLKARLAPREIKLVVENQSFSLLR